MLFRKKETKGKIKKGKYEVTNIQSYEFIKDDKHIVRTFIYCKKGRKRKKDCVKIHDYILEELK